jgi:hypothetical protein
MHRPPAVPLAQQTLIPRDSVPGLETGHKIVMATTRTTTRRGPHHSSVRAVRMRSSVVIRRRDRCGLAVWLSCLPQFASWSDCAGRSAWHTFPSGGRFNHRGNLGRTTEAQLSPLSVTCPVLVDIPGILGDLRAVRRLRRGIPTAPQPEAAHTENHHQRTDGPPHPTGLARGRCARRPADPTAGGCHRYRRSAAAGRDRGRRGHHHRRRHRGSRSAGCDNGRQPGDAEHHGQQGGPYRDPDGSGHVLHYGPQAVRCRGRAVRRSRSRESATDTVSRSYHKRVMSGFAVQAVRSYLVDARSGVGFRCRNGGGWRRRRMTVATTGCCR